jgi:hypothetical protein
VVHVQVLEDLDVILGAISSSVVLRVQWAHERDKLAWNGPVQITVLNFFVVLILLGVESSKVVPAMHHCKFQPLQAMEDSAIVIAITV